jgi:hypothetical protein
LEEARYGYDHENQPWNKWDVLHLVRAYVVNGPGCCNLSMYENTNTYGANIFAIQ